MAAPRAVFASREWQIYLTEEFHEALLRSDHSQLP
jgi:hypothetical protein